MRDQSVYFSGRTNCTVQFFLVILSVIFLSLFTLPANAQKAHYSGPQSTVVSGYGSWFRYAVAVDGSGNVYTAAVHNNRVVKVPWTGSGYGPQSTFSGVSGPFGVAVDGSGNVYISDYGNNRVLKGTWAGSGTARRVLWGACRTPVA